MPVPFDEIDTRRIRIKQIASELQRWPSQNLVETLCNEAERGCTLDPQCAFWFFAVRDVGLELLSEGAGTALRELPKAIERLDDAVAVRKMNSGRAGRVAI